MFLYICQSTEWYRYNLCIFWSGFSVKLCLKEKNEISLVYTTGNNSISYLVIINMKLREHYILDQCLIFAVCPMISNEWDTIAQKNIWKKVFFVDEKSFRWERNFYLLMLNMRYRYDDVRILYFTKEWIRVIEKSCWFH